MVCALVLLITHSINQIEVFLFPSPTWCWLLLVGVAAIEKALSRIKSIFFFFYFFEVDDCFQVTSRSKKLLGETRFGVEKLRHIKFLKFSFFYFHAESWDFLIKILKFFFIKIFKIFLSKFFHLFFEINKVWRHFWITFRKYRQERKTQFW